MTSLGRLTPPAREYRAATPRTYTTDRVAALTAASTSGPAAIATATAAVEIAAGVWGRALSLANVSPQTARTRAITPGLLELTGRALARRGQVVFDLEVDAGGDLALLPCAASSVLIGSADPRTWVYVLSVNGPSSTRTVYRARGGVVHLQAGTQPDRPWQGRAPWQTAQLSGALLAGVERQLAGEAESASGYILPTPDTGDRGQAADADGDEDPLTALRPRPGRGARATLLAPSMAAGFGGGPGRVAHHIAGISRPSIRRESARLPDRAAAGMSSGASCRPTAFYRRCFTSGRPGPRCVRRRGKCTRSPPCPWPELVAAQLSEALNEPVTLDLRRGRATDTRPWRARSGHSSRRRRRQRGARNSRAMTLPSRVDGRVPESPTPRGARFCPARHFTLPRSWWVPVDARQRAIFSIGGARRVDPEAF